MPARPPAGAQRSEGVHDNNVQHEAAHGGGIAKKKEKKVWEIENSSTILSHNIAVRSTKSSAPKLRRDKVLENSTVLEGFSFGCTILVRKYKDHFVFNMDNKMIFTFLRRVEHPLPLTILSLPILKKHTECKNG